MSNVTKLPTSEEFNIDQAVVSYVLDQMSDAEKQEFEDRIARDPELKARVELEMKLRDGIQGSFPLDRMEDHLNQDSFNQANFQQRIMESSNQDLSGDSLNGGASNQDQVKPRFQWLVASAAALAITFFSIGQFSQAPVAEYEGLSSDSPDVVSNIDGLLYTIVFDGQLELAQRQALASDMNFEIVSGPGAGNAYVIRTSEPLSEEIMGRLLKHPSIDFLEPVR